MTAPALIRPTGPKIEGSDYTSATYYDEVVDAEIPVLVGYDIEGFRKIAIQSVHHDHGRSGWGPDMLSTLSEMQVDELAAEVCRKLPWDKRRDERDQAGYAPRCGGL